MLRRIERFYVVRRWNPRFGDEGRERKAKKDFAKRAGDEKARARRYAIYLACRSQSVCVDICFDTGVLFLLPPKRTARGLRDLHPKQQRAERTDGGGREGTSLSSLLVLVED